MRPYLVFFGLMLLPAALYGQQGNQTPLRDLQTNATDPQGARNVFDPDTRRQEIDVRQRAALAKERMRKIRENTELLQTLTAKLYASMQTHEAFDDADRKLLEQIEKAARDAEKWMKQ